MTISQQRNKGRELKNGFNKFCDDNGFNSLRSECIDWWLSHIDKLYIEIVKGEIERWNKIEVSGGGSGRRLKEQHLSYLQSQLQELEKKI